MAGGGNALALTLTYRNDPGKNHRADMAERMVKERHVRQFLKNMRKKYKFSWLGVSEHGELRKRVHFHLVMIFEGLLPPIPDRERWHMPEWPHGHVWGEWGADEASIKYALKYTLKENGYPGGWYSHTRSLAYEQIIDWGRAYARVAERLPTNGAYRPATLRGGQFYLRGKPRRRGVRACLEELCLAGIPVRTQSTSLLILGDVVREYRERQQELIDDELRANPDYFLTLVEQAHKETQQRFETIFRNRVDRENWSEAKQLELDGIVLSNAWKLAKGDPLEYQRLMQEPEWAALRDKMLAVKHPLKS